MQRPNTRKLTGFALGAALLATACTAGGQLAEPTTTTTAGGEPDPQATHGFSRALQPFEACEDFLAYVKDNAVAVVGPYGLPGWGGMLLEGDIAATDAAEAAGDVAAPTAGAPVQGVDYSGTNVQEAGVDEPDIVKTDGTRILAIGAGQLHYVDVSGDTPQLLGSMQFEDLYPSQMLVSGDHVLLFSSTDSYAYPTATDVIGPGPYGYSPVTVITQVDISDPPNMAITRTLSVDGGQLAARMVGDSIRLVVNSLPTGLEFVQPSGGGLRAEREALEANRQVILDSTLENWVPYYVLESADGVVEAEGSLLECADASHPEAFSGLGMLTVLTIDAAGDLTPGSAAGVLTDGQTVYASANSLYVATNQWFDWNAETEAADDDPQDSYRTQIHRFDISDPANATYAGSGEVEGYLLSQWSMSEHEGHLRVASTDTSPWFGWTADDDSQVTVLRIDADGLTTVGEVGGLGAGEQIYAVRFMGTTGYVVTFRQTDPLYVIDLTNPASPSTVGELKIPGYSSYLHPVGDGLILGVGQDATETGQVLGSQVSLFDVRDPANPVRIDQLAIEGGYSEAEYDHHAFLYWAPTGLSLVPLSVYTWDEASQTDDYYTGALAVRVTADGIADLGRITHAVTPEGPETTDPYYYDYGAQIRRSLVVGDTVFTMSENGIKASNLETLADEGWVSFI